ncbi:MAG: hypothetical protein H6622_05690 [Halobacteriovoraceae bacterium]|nr:hypothetical protein [Halobacteriovoraceae bacterium]
MGKNYVSTNQLELFNFDTLSAQSGIGPVVERNQKKNRKKKIQLRAPVKEENSFLGPVLTDYFQGRKNHNIRALLETILNDEKTTYPFAILFGTSGSGKSHTCQCLANEIKKRFPMKQICLRNGKEFLYEYKNYLSQGKFTQFFLHYTENIDYLIIDDFDLAVNANDKQFQEDFSILIGHLKNYKKLVLLTMKSPPVHLKYLYERLKKRLGWAVIEGLSLGDELLVERMLSAELDKYGITLKDDVYRFCVNYISQDLNLFIGLMDKIKILLESDGIVDLPVLKQQLSTLYDNLDDDKLVITCNEKVSEFFGITHAHPKMRGRGQGITLVRQVAMHYLYHNKNYSLTRLAKAFDRDHTTILHSVRKISKKIDENNYFSKDYNDLKNILNELFAKK